MSPLDPFVVRRRIAYLSREIGFDAAVPIHAGGLGVAAPANTWRP